MQGVTVSGRGLREQIDVLLAHGATLRDIEREVIESAPIGEDARDALWLYAWGHTARDRFQRPQRPAS